MIKLSKSQQVLFDKLKAGEVVCYMRAVPRLNPSEYFYEWESGDRCTQAARGLINKGLAKIKKNKFGSNVLLLIREV